MNIDFTPDKSDPFGVIGSDGDTVLLGGAVEAETLQKVREVLSMSGA